MGRRRKRGDSMIKLGATPRFSLFAVDVSHRFRVDLLGSWRIWKLCNLGLLGVCCVHQHFTEALSELTDRHQQSMQLLKTKLQKLQRGLLPAKLQLRSISLSAEHVAWPRVQTEALHMLIWHDFKTGHVRWSTWEASYPSYAKGAAKWVGPYGRQNFGKPRVLFVPWWQAVRHPLEIPYIQTNDLWRLPRWCMQFDLHVRVAEWHSDIWSGPFQTPELSRNNYFFKADSAEANSGSQKIGVRKHSQAAGNATGTRKWKATAGHCERQWMV